MYICICNGVSERDVRECVRAGARSIEDLGAQLGVGTCCGRCRDCAHALIDDHSNTPIAQHGLSPA